MLRREQQMLGFVLCQETSDRFGELSTLADPVVDAVTLEVDGGGVGAGVVGADNFDRTAIAGTVFFNNNDAVVGLFTRSNARQTDHQHRGFPLNCWIFVRKGRCGDLGGSQRRTADLYARTTHYRGFCGIRQWTGQCYVTA